MQTKLKKRTWRERRVELRVQDIFDEEINFKFQLKDQEKQKHRNQRLFNKFFLDLKAQSLDVAKSNLMGFSELSQRIDCFLDKIERVLREEKAKLDKKYPELELGIFSKNLFIELRYGVEDAMIDGMWFRYEHGAGLLYAHEIVMKAIENQKILEGKLTENQFDTYLRSIEERIVAMVKKLGLDKISLSQDSHLMGCDYGSLYVIYLLSKPLAGIWEFAWMDENLALLEKELEKVA